MDVETRIRQFKQMAEADPENELGHFSLGKAYADAGRFEEAIEPLRRTLELKPAFSKAYQLLGEVYDKAGKRERAIEVLTRGVTVADEQGDRMPRDAIAATLNEWGAPVPEFAKPGVFMTEEATTRPSDGGFQCARCGRPHGQLPKAPFKGSLGEKVLHHICDACWREWVPMGTKVINELGLTLSSEAGQETYDQYMIEFLQLEDG